LQNITTHLRKLKRSNRAISTVITVMLSLVLLVIIVGNVFLNNFQMNQVDAKKNQENLSITNALYSGTSPWFNTSAQFTLNTGTLQSGSIAGTLQLGDSNFETFRQENPQINYSSNPSGFVLDGSTTNPSGSVSNLVSNDGNCMTFGSYPSSLSAQTLYAHKETTNIAGTAYNNSMLTNADTSGVTLSASLAGSRSLLDKSVYSLQGVQSIPASTWNMYYRTWKDATTSVPTNNPSSTSGGWTNPTNAYADGGGYASSTMNGTVQFYSGYSFSIPGGATITQVQVRLDAYVSGGDTNDKILLEVSDDGETWLSTTQQQNLSTSETTYWIDVTSWTSWTPLMVNNIQTRVTQIRSGISTDEVRLDWIPVEVTYSTSAVDTKAPSSTNPSSGGWTNPTYAYTSDSSYAYSSTNGRQQTYYGYGYNIPSDSAITQVRIKLEAWASGFYEQNDDIKVEVSADAGSHWLTATQTISLGTIETTYWVDVTTWTTWNPASINNDNLRVRVTQVRVGYYTDTVRLDYIPFEVTYSESTSVTQSPSSLPNVWTNPTNAYANGGSYVSSGYNGGEQQVYGGYGFAVPAGAQITQVRVRLDAWCSYDDLILLQVSTDSGATWLSSSQSIAPTTSEATYWVPITSWISWTPSSLNNDNIRLRVTHIMVNGLGYVYLDWMPIEVTYTLTATAHIDADILVRTSMGAVRTTVATNVASSSDLSTSAQTLSATYSFPGYTVTDQTDYLEIDYYADPTVIGSVNAYLIIDNSSLALADQTRASNVMLPNQYTMQVEVTGTGTMPTAYTLLWSIDGSFSVSSVNTLVQVYSYNSGQYPTSGDGWMSYTSNPSAGVHDTKSQIVISNPTYFLSGSVWQIRITATYGSPFSFNLDWTEFKAVTPNTYMLDMSNSFAINVRTYPAKHVSTVEVLLAYNVSDTGERWFIKACNWTTSTFSNAGFNDTAGSQPSAPKYWVNYVVGIPSGYIASDGTLLIEFCSGVPSDSNQTIVSIDYLGVRVVMDGQQDWTVKNSSPETVHIVAVWIENSTLHQHYSVDLYLNSGDSNNGLIGSQPLPMGTYVTKVVTERGTIVVWSSG